MAKTNLKEILGTEATCVAAAPGRVNLIGEHIDYCDGFVLPFAIERYIVVVGAFNGSDEARLCSAGQPKTSFTLDDKLAPGEPKWANYIKGVVAGFQERGFKVPGFDLSVVSSVPSGGGLSSSAALECAVATFLEGLLDTNLKTKEKALLAQKAEHEFAGVPCGIMDQFASAFGQKDNFILIDCKTREPELVSFKNDDLTILIANTCVSHDLSDGSYAERRKDTEDGLAIIEKESWRDVTMAEVEAYQDKLGERIFRRSRHVVSEIERTRQTVEALQNKDYAPLGLYMKASHESLRDDFEVSCEELDLMVSLAEEIGFEGGVLGSRMTGGGFGGSTVTLCRVSQVKEIAVQLAERYEAKTKIKPELFCSRPAQGAHLVRLI